MTINMKTGKPIVLSGAAERRNLHEHGTKAFPELTARNILQAAERDVRYAAANKIRRRNDDRTLPYSFPNKIADTAASATQILAAMVEKCPPAKTPEEHMLWGDRDKLAEALRLAQEKGA
jgi:hypothetical protein